MSSPSQNRRWQRSALCRATVALLKEGKRHGVRPRGGRLFLAWGLSSGELLAVSNFFSPLIYKVNSFTCRVFDYVKTIYLFNWGFHLLMIFVILKFAKKLASLQFWRLQTVYVLLDWCQSFNYLFFKHLCTNFCALKSWVSKLGLFLA